MRETALYAVGLAGGGLQERLYGSVVLDWTTRDPNTSITDAYPPQG
ncbi:hypothetical protein ACN6LM_000785 [Streptomyces sp. SAS_281]